MLSCIVIMIRHTIHSGITVPTHAFLSSTRSNTLFSLTSRARLFSHSSFMARCTPLSSLLYHMKSSHLLLTTKTSTPFHSVLQHPLLNQCHVIYSHILQIRYLSNLMWIYIVTLGLFAIRKSGFKDFPAIPKELDLVEREDQITFEIGLEEEVIRMIRLNK